MDTQDLIGWLSERERVNAARGDREAERDCHEMQDLVRRRRGESSE